MLQMKPDDDAYEKVKKDLEYGIPLNCKMLTDIFGWPIVELFLVMAGPYSKEQFDELLENLRLTRITAQLTQG